MTDSKGAGGMKVAIACVADSKTKYLYQSLRLALSLKQLNSMHELTLFVGIFPGVEDYFVSALSALGARVSLLPVYSEVHGPSNKMQILRHPDLMEFDYIVMCDCDIVFVREFDEIFERQGVQAKIADLKTLPDVTLRSVFTFANRKYPLEQYRSTLDDLPIIRYCNAGVLAISQNIFSSFVDRWFFWNDQLLARRDLLKQSVFFTDQASLALVIDEFGDDFIELGVEMNYPIHAPAARYPESVRSASATVLHYHDAVNPMTGGLKYCIDGCQNEAVEAINDRIMTCDQMRRGPVFWDYIYSEAETRYEDDEFRMYRRGLLSLIMDRCKPKSILDFGCGADPLIAKLSFQDYLGVDFSREAVERAKNEVSAGRFMVSDIRQCVEYKAELVIVLDVLPYVGSHEEYNAIIERAVAASTDWVLVSGLMSRSDREGSFATEYYENVEDTLRRHNKLNFVKIGSAAGQDFFLGESAS